MHYNLLNFSRKWGVTPAFCSVAQLFLSMSGEAPPPCVSCKRWPCNSGGGACRICASAFELIRIAQGASFTSADFRDLSSQLSFLVGEFVIRGGGPKSGGEPLAFDKSPEGSERPRGEHTPQRIDRPQSPVHQGGLDREGRSLPLAGRGRNSPRRSSPVRKEESRSSRRIRSSDNSDKDEAHRERHRRRRRRSSKEETDSDLELRDRPSETDSRKPDKSWVPSLRPRVDSSSHSGGLNANLRGSVADHYAKQRAPTPPKYPPSSGRRERPPLLRKVSPSFPSEKSPKSNSEFGKGQTGKGGKGSSGGKGQKAKKKNRGLKRKDWWEKRCESRRKAKEGSLQGPASPALPTAPVEYTEVATEEGQENRSSDQLAAEAVLAARAESWHWADASEVGS